MPLSEYPCLHALPGFCYCSACKKSCRQAAKELEAAKSELAGLEPGDGSDVSSRSLPQHLKDAEAEVVRFEPSFFEN
jgi:hypothetical protein